MFDLHMKFVQYTEKIKGEAKCINGHFIKKL